MTSKEIKHANLAKTVMLGRGTEPMTERFGSPTTGGGRLPAEEASVEVGDLHRPTLRRLDDERPLASGGMGAISVAHDRALGRQVAVKTLHGHLATDISMRQLFLREARVMGLLDHPHIVPVYDVGEREDGRLSLLMKLVEGRTLASMIHALPRGPIGTSTLYTLLDVVTKVCDALAFAHDRGVLHCDIKPSNVMVGDYGQVYLTDWGIARFEASPPRTHRGAPGLGDDSQNVIIGTVGYMSPEQARGERGSLDARADVFLMGAMLYEVLARRPPYPTRDQAEAIALASACSFPPPRAIAGEGVIPTELERIVLRAMAREPFDRYGSIGELRDDLLQFMRGGSEFPSETYGPGALILREGDQGDAAYIVAAGRCEVRKKLSGGGQSVVKVLGPGDVFGEMAILTSSPRTASVVATRETTVLVLTAKALEAELAALKPWMATLLHSLAKRFREADIKRATALAVPGSLQLANQIYMQLRTWGTPATGGGLQVPWSTLSLDLEATFAVPALSIWQLVASLQLFELDVQGDTVTLRDVARAEAFLTHELGKPPR